MNKTLINDKYLLSDILFECKCVLYFIDVSKTASFNYIRNINKKINTKSSEIGKTCLVRRYIKDSFNEHTLESIGMDFASKYIKIGWNI